MLLCIYIYKKYIYNNIIILINLFINYTILVYNLIFVII